MSSLTEEIQILKKEKQAMILAHYYVPDEVQEIADVTGDSFYLSKVAKEADAKILVFAGVSFMGESAKILNPEKKVLLPDPAADCAMAHMADVEKIRAMRNRYPYLAVVCYINSTAKLKQYADVCGESSKSPAEQAHLFYSGSTSRKLRGGSGAGKRGDSGRRVLSGTSPDHSGRGAAGPKSPPGSIGFRSS